MIDDLPVRWTVPWSYGGSVQQRICCDPATGSFFAQWGNSHGKNRVRRLSLHTGELLAEVRTRQQSVGALALHRGLLYIASDTRLFEVNPVDLEITRQWNRNLVRFTQRIVPLGNVLVTANWKAESIGLFDLDAEKVTKRRVGVQPVLVATPGGVDVVAGFDGGIRSLDPARLRLTAPRPTPPVTAAVHASGHTYAVLAGPVDGPPDTPLLQRRDPTNVVVKLGDEDWRAELRGACTEILADEGSGTLWCSLYRGKRLQQIALTDGQVLNTVTGGENHRFKLVDPVAGVALRFDYHVPSTEGRADLVCLELPTASHR